MSQLFQITEEDLSTLERECPALLGVNYEGCNDPLTHRRWQEVKRILSDVRWNYGPPSNVENIEP
jgi:hypothetical protein